LPIVLDDELGKAVGLESLAELREEVRQQMRRDYDAASRLRLKRALLDKLAAAYEFPVPPGMVDLEFDNIWRQHQAEQERERADQSEAADPESARSDDMPTESDQAPSAGSGEAADTPVADAAEATADATQTDSPQSNADESEQPPKTDYRKIAERRVRLGLLLAEVGRNNNITVTQDELNHAITREARRHPGYERQVLDFYRQNPEAVANLRAPIFEDKVIDFIVELAKVEERRITPQELLSTPDPGGQEAPAE